MAYINDDELFNLQQLHHTAVAQVVCVVVYWWFLCRRLKRKRLEIPREVMEKRDIDRQLLLADLANDVKYHNIYRMGIMAFHQLCHILRSKSGLRPT